MKTETVYEVEIQGKTLFADFNYNIEGEPAEQETGFKGASYIADIDIFFIGDEDGNPVEYMEQEVEEYIIDNFKI